MRTIISAIIIYDSDKDIKKDLSFSFNIPYAESNFDILHIKNSNEIYKALNNYRGIDCIISVGKIDYLILNNLSYEFRKKWVHFETYLPEKISATIIDILAYNINKDRDFNKLFSIFTCSYKTPKYQVERLYNSLCNQTYPNWNWWILDDNPDDYNEKNWYKELNDPRITIIKNVSIHGNIGFNKHMIAMCCDGDYLVEIDHDDEILPNCLSKLYNAFSTYQDTDFVYSYALEETNGQPINYGEYFALGLGKYENFNIPGFGNVSVPITPDINALSLRHIVSLPNHVRCWKKDFYHKIGGHNIELSVLDDMDILIRTALNGKICKIPDVLYIQHENSSDNENERSSTTQGKRMGEIWRTGRILKLKYDKEIHDFFINNELKDPYWDEIYGYSNIYQGVKPETININYIYNL